MASLADQYTLRCVSDLHPPFCPVVGFRFGEEMRPVKLTTKVFGWYLERDGMKQARKMYKRRKNPSPSPRRLKSRSPSPWRRKSRSPAQKRNRRKRSRSVTSSPITKPQSPHVALAENKNAIDKQRLEEEKNRTRSQTKCYWNGEQCF